LISASATVSTQALTDPRRRSGQFDSLAPIVAARAKSLNMNWRISRYAERFKAFASNAYGDSRTLSRAAARTQRLMATRHL
jgi:hypothetical protein